MEENTKIVPEDASADIATEEAPRPHNAAKDLVFGILLTCFGIFVVVDSLGMKIYKNFIDAPGFFPCIIGSVLIVFGLLLTLIGLKAGGVKELGEVLNAKFLGDFIKNDRTVRVLILLAMMVVYIYILLGRVHFIIATSVYLAANFMYLGAFSKRKWYIALIISVAVAVIASMVVYYGFRYGFSITMP